MILPKTVAFTITCVSIGMIVLTIRPFLLNIFTFNKCGMTVMLEPPLFLPLNHTKYKLYLYTEGVEDPGVLGADPNEIPVVFIPGSGGSKNQVRSLATVMKDKKKRKNTKYTYRFFTCDFKEENTILNGHMLRSQTRFVVDALEELRKMYKNRKIIIFGHSLGGTVAMGLVTDPRFKIDWIDMFILKSAPVQVAPIVLDNSFRDYYVHWQNIWNEKQYDDFAIISYSGGLKDVLVADPLTKYGYSAAVPIWNIDEVPDHGTDHLCIVWCNQVVRHTSRLLEAYAENRGKIDTKLILKQFLERETAIRDNKFVIRSIVASEQLELGSKKVIRAKNDQYVVSVMVRQHQIVQIKTIGQCVRSVTQVRANSFRNTQIRNGTTLVTTISRNDVSGLVRLVFSLDNNCQFNVEVSTLTQATAGLFFDIFLSNSNLIVACALIFLAYIITSIEEIGEEEQFMIWASIAVSFVFPIVYVNDEIIPMVPVILGLLICMAYFFIVEIIWLVTTVFWPAVIDMRLNPDNMEQVLYGAFCSVIISPILTCFIVISILTLNRSIKKFVLAIPYFIPLFFKLKGQYETMDFLSANMQHCFCFFSFLVFYVFSNRIMNPERSIFTGFFILSSFTYYTFEHLSLEAMTGFLLILLVLKHFQV